MDRRTFGIALGGLLASGCDRAPRQSLTATPRPTTMKNDLVFVTRDGCEHTPDMLINVNDALRALGLPLDYQIVNLGTLPQTDPRSGYPTPTVLYHNRDLFGMPEPTPPFPEPS
jgi:hypothetical protein